MKAFWLLLAILLGGGLAAWLIGADGRAANEPVTRPTPVEAASPTLAEPPVALSPVAPSVAKPATAPSEVPQPQSSQPPESRIVRLDGRFEIVGRGNEDDPFRVNWQALGSARESINATTGTLTIPEWLAPLDGAWIEISGYFAPTMQSEATSELLFTMNRWDGCCIGLPPTVFDSAALKLEKEMSLLGQHLIRFGTVRGELHIEPFAAGGMMLGLYRIDHGKITTQSGG
jgi:hypothetical protein